MKKSRFLCVAALAAAVVAGSAVAAVAENFKTDAPKTVKTSDGRTLNLVWNDEFNGDGLPDPEKWGYEVGYIRNNEEQYYTDARVENIFQKDGLLTIRTIREDFNIAGKRNSKGRDTAKYTSAAIETDGKASWLYGRVEVRAKLPSGKGIWPAIWMLGDNIHQEGWARCGEIDIMEYVGHTPFTAHATIHMQRKGGQPWENVSKGHALKLDKDGEKPEERFYVYALEWTEDKLLLFVDDVLSLEFKRSEEEPKTATWPFDKPQYLILNTAIGGAWGGEVDESICPCDFQIDYVRVYQ